MILKKQRQVMAETNKAFDEALASAGVTRKTATRAQKREAAKVAKAKMETAHSGAVDIAFIMKIVKAILAALTGL